MSVDDHDSIQCRDGAAAASGETAGSWRSPPVVWSAPAARRRAASRAARCGVLLALTILCPLACASKTEREARHLLRGQEYFDAKRYREAEIEFRNALQLDPKLAAAHFRLGMTYLAMKDSSGASVELQRAIELDDSLREAHLELGRLYLAGGAPDKAEEKARLLIERNANDIAAQLLLATRCLSDGMIEDAETAVDRALTVDPNSAPAHLMRGRLLAVKNEFEQAEREMERAIQFDSASLESYLTLAALYKLRGGYAAFEATLHRASAAAPKDGAPLLQLGELYISEGKSDDALALYARMVEQGIEGATAKKRMVDLQLELGKLPEAERGVADLIAADKGDIETRYLHGRLLLVKDDVTGAVHELEQVLKEWPGLVRAHYQLALARLRENKVEQAEAELGQCVRYEPDFARAHYLLAQLHFRAKEFDLAVEEAQRVVAVAPHNFEMGVLLVDALTARRDFAAARERGEQLVREFPDRAAAYQRLGRALANLGQLADARAQLEHGLQIDAAAVDILDDIVAVMARDHQPPAQRIERVRAHVAAHPDSGGMHALLGQLLLANGDTADATRVLEDAVRLSPNLLFAYYLLGNTYASQGKLREARAHFTTLLQREPRLVAAHMVLGMLDEIEGHPKDAATAYQRALDIDPNFGPAANNLAWHYAEREDKLDLALELARRAKTALPDEPRVADTLGWVLYRRGLYPAAIEHLKESADKLPGDAQVHYHLGMAYLRNGDTDQARAELSTALKLGTFPEANNARRALEQMG